MFISSKIRLFAERSKNAMEKNNLKISAFKRAYFHRKKAYERKDKRKGIL